MAGIFGALGFGDTDRIFASTQGQTVVLDAIQTYLNRVNNDLNMALSIFVEGDTEGYTERYKLPGGGRLRRRGTDGRYGVAKASGGWDVAYPLEDFGSELGGDDVVLAYMTAGDMDRHLSTVTIQNVNTVRFEVLKALFNDSNATFVDALHGSLTIRRLANTDGSTYPPVLGSESEADEDHYLESGYAAASISDSNNPYITIRQELEEHFGASTGGDNIVVFIHPDEVPETEDLTSFHPVIDSSIRAGANTDIPVNLPMVPGKILGRVEGCWAVEWRWMPSGYMLAIHMDAPAPLKRRVDPADTGLGRGLQLIVNEQQFPHQVAVYRHRFGLGVANRLNGVVMELGTGGTYTIPTAYQ
jgi:hypothetical protein